MFGLARHQGTLQICFQSRAAVATLLCLGDKAELSHLQPSPESPWEVLDLR